MNQEKINKLKKMYLGTKRETQISSSLKFREISSINSNHERRETSEDSKVQILQLRISTDQDSPIYKDFNGADYVEQIDSNAFDESLSEVKSGNKIIYSYADHKMDSQNIVSSTQREGTKLYKDSNNDYVMEIELDPKEELHKRIIKLVKNKELNANSFIFVPEEIEIHEGDRDDVAYTIIQKKGNLFSIDAVIYPWYPENKLLLKGADMAEIKKTVSKENQEDLEVKKDINEVKDTEVKEVKKETETEKEVEVEKETDKETDKETEAKEAKEAEEAKLEQEKIEKEAEAKLDKETDYKALSIAEQRSLFAKISKREFTIEEAIKSIKTKVSDEKQEKRDTIVKSLKEQKGEKMTEQEKLQKRDSNVKNWILDGDHQSAQMRAEGASDRNEDAENVGKDIAKRNLATIKKNKISEKELEIMGINKRSLTGADASSGALIIPVSTQNTIIGEGVEDFPEIDGALPLAAQGLSETKLPISVGTDGEATAIAEGVDSAKYDSSVVKLQLALTRYAEHFDYNPLLAEHAPIVSQKTIELSNRQIRSMKKAFYTNLTAKAATSFATDNKTYDGGVRSESVMETSVAGKLTIADLDAAILREMNKTGSLDKSRYTFKMKPETYLALVNEAKAAKVANSKFELMEGDVTIQGYDGIKVITSRYFTDEVATGKFPVVLSKKASVAKYSGYTVLKDSVELEFKSDMKVRQLTTRGNVKHADPLYGVTTIKVK